MIEHYQIQNRTERLREQQVFERLRIFCFSYVSTYSDYQRSVAEKEIKNLLEKTDLADGYEGLMKNLNKQREKRNAA